MQIGVSFPIVFSSRIGLLGSFDASGAEILRCCSAADHRSLGRRAKSLLDLYLIPLDFRAGLALKSATPG